MRVEILSHTPNPEQLVATAAKLCYSNSNIEDLKEKQTPEKVENFIDQLNEMGHQSPLEHISFTFAIEDVSRSLLAQLTRHRIASYCITGDTIVGYNQKTKGLTVKELSEKTTQYKQMVKLRSIDEKSKEIFNNNVIDAWYSGKKEVFEVTTEDGYKIKTTKEHEFFTGKCYKKLKDLAIGDIVYTNGIEAYKNQDWLNEKYREENLTQSQIGDLCGVSKHTIRSWVARFGLQKEAGSWSIGVDAPNKNKTKNDYAPMSIVSKKMMGNHNAENRIYQLNLNPKTISGGYFLTHRKYKKTGSCSICGKKGYTELHHKDRNPKNTDANNIVELCLKCHKIEHKGMFVMACKPSKIKNIALVGMEDTYDIEMKSPYNNFVANGFIVHNCVQSQRYVDMKDFKPVIPNDVKNNAFTMLAFNKCLNVIKETYDYITEMLEEEYVKNGVDTKLAHKQAIENARTILPNACPTKIIMTMNARSLLNFFELRCCNNAQAEIRELANKMLVLCKQVAPNVFKNAGASCVRGKCREGKKSCGHPYPKNNSNNQIEGQMKLKNV